VGDAADLVVISTDLSHYLPIERARRRDRRTADAVLALDAVTTRAACSRSAVRLSSPASEGWR
jgi:AmmeMemoRadiSam system protein B